MPSQRLLCLGLLALCLAWAEGASAQSREFNGVVRQIGASSLVAESRMGESLTFERNAKTQVEGKASWDAIAPGDRVIVRWTLAAGPVIQRVIVLPARR